MINIEAKAVVLGHAGVGKTSVVMRCVRDLFDKNTAATIGAAFFTHDIVVGDVKVHLQIWDTAGQERFRSMAPMYYRKAAVAILVYDITDAQSFLLMKGWVNELKRNVDRPVYIIIFGNKCDLKDRRKVSVEVAREYAESIGADFLETSACSSVQEGFRLVAKQLIDGCLSSVTYATVYDANGDVLSSKDLQTAHILTESNTSQGQGSCKC